MPDSEEIISIIPLTEVADNLEKAVKAEMQKAYSEAYYLNCLHLETIGRLAHLFTNELIRNPIEDTKVDQETAHLVEIAGYLHDGAKIGEDILMHHIASKAQTNKTLNSPSFIGLLTPKQKGVIENAIVRHQGMPYLDEVALANLMEERNAATEKQAQGGELQEQENIAIKRWDQLVNSDPLVEVLRRFPPPNDEVSAILYSADLLSLGNTHREEEDPRAGAFDKIVQTQLGWGSTLEEAIRSAQISLENSVIRLQNAQPYTAKEIERMRELGFGEEEFQGRERAAKIERTLGNKFGEQALHRINTLVDFVKIANSAEELENSMECYYRLARSSTELISKEI